MNTETTTTNTTEADAAIPTHIAMYISKELDAADKPLQERLEVARRENSDLRMEVTHLTNHQRSMQDHYLGQIRELKKLAQAYKDELAQLRA